MNHHVAWILVFCSVVALLSAMPRSIVIADFDSGFAPFYSYPGEDIEPNSASLDNTTTFNNSPFALHITGNSWKLLDISPTSLDAKGLWSIAVNYRNTTNISGFLLSDGIHELRYSFAGEEVVSIDQWVTVYQGAQPEEEWFSYMLPVGHDWLARFDTLTTITTIGFINDEDNYSTGEVYFDEILDITDEASIAPSVQFTNFSRSARDAGSRSVSVQFSSRVRDPDSDSFSWFWDFGDGGTAISPNPQHNFTIADDHDYRVLLRVTDDTGLIGLASRRVLVDPGISSLPLKINFTGDIMLARNIFTQIVEPNQSADAVFEPTLSILGNAADITAVNLECPFTNATVHHPTKSIYFKSAPYAASSLTYAGIDYATLANNHIMDYLEPGMQETFTVLDSVGVKHNGAGENSTIAGEPIFINSKGITVAFCASSDRTGQYNNAQPFLDAGYDKPGFALMTPYNIQQQISQVRDDADVVIMQFHAGSEYSLVPGEDYDNSDYLTDENWRLDIPHMWDIQMRHFAIDAGADAVIVHHPHIIQGIEVYHGKVIAHSLGNFAFDLSYLETMPSMILNAEIDHQGIHNYSITPVFIRNYIPQPATGELGAYILRYLAFRSRQLNTILSVDTANNRATVLLDGTGAQRFFSDHTAGTNSIVTEDGYFVSAPMALTFRGSIHHITSAQPAASWQIRLGSEQLWQANMEDEGADLWSLNSQYEGYCSDESYRGERSLALAIPSNYPGNIISTLRYKIKRRPGFEYTLHGWVKAQNATHATIAARTYSSRYANHQSYITHQDPDVYLDGDTDWTPLFKDLSLSDNARYFDIRCDNYPSTADTSRAWFDDVGLIQWGEWHNLDSDFLIDFPNAFSHAQMRTTTPVTSAQFGYTTVSYAASSRESKPDPGNAKSLYNVRNHPNPFNPVTMISYQLPEANEVSITIFNVKGQRVKKLLHEQQAPGFYRILWNGTNDENIAVSSGVYFYKVSIEGTQDIVRKCLLLK